MFAVMFGVFLKCAWIYHTQSELVLSWRGLVTDHGVPALASSSLNWVHKLCELVVIICSDL